MEAFGITSATFVCIILALIAFIRVIEDSREDTKKYDEEIKRQREEGKEPVVRDFSKFFFWLAGIALLATIVILIYQLNRM
ncbi:hypothetical protein [Guptibacillus spartinae]|uniref:hypothetical protein n=1 Tax=Guptibacillus spartinae TaxID=3025679 RepID=UPI0023629C53|nr:hypothetical protein [Pseudalkalibacillus spartinae]